MAWNKKEDTVQARILGRDVIANQVPENGPFLFEE